MSDTQHKAICACGVYRNQAHAINIKQIEENHLGQRFAPCLDCGAIIFLDKGFGQVGQLSLSVLKRSAKGSLILSNGQILLYPDDIEEYYSGTLMFYDENSQGELM